MKSWVWVICLYPAYLAVSCFVYRTYKSFEQSTENFSAFFILNNLSFNFSFQANWIFLIMQNYQPAHLVLISQKSKLEFWCSTWADQGILERSSNFWQIYSWIVISSSCHFKPNLVHLLPKGVLRVLLKSIMKLGEDRRFSIGQLNRYLVTYS